MNKNLMRVLGAGLMATTIAFGSTIKPAAADEGTTNTIIAAAAALAIGLTAANVAHKDAVANTVEGYTPYGGTVYEDGHVVLPNGQSYYPGNNGQSISCNGGACAIGGGYGYGNGYAYGPGGYHGQRWGR
jgi:hypothetical protein